MKLFAAEVTFRTKEGFNQEDGQKYWAKYDDFTLVGRHQYKVSMTINAVNFLGAIELALCGVISSDPKIATIILVKAWEIQP
jgi:hypothetical protein